MRSLYKLSIKPLLARSMPETSWQNLCNRISTMSLYKVSVRRALARPLFKISIRGLFQDLCKGPLGKVSKDLQDLFCRNLCTGSLEQFSWQDLCKRLRSLYRSLEGVSWLGLLDKISIRGLLATSLYEISVQVLYKSSAGKISKGDLKARSLRRSL